MVKYSNFINTLLVSLLTFGVLSASGQIFSSTLKTIRNIGSNVISNFATNGNHGRDMMSFDALSGTAAALSGSEAIERARQFMTVIASSMGPLALPYSLDFTLSANINSTYHYIIVGGGSAGAVLASRLSENPNIRVLLLEAGGEENLLSTIPMSAFLLQKSFLDWNYKSVPQAKAAWGLNGQCVPAPRGKAVGGSSSINYMLYVRGNKRDYDRWGELGASGWSYESVFPYFIKSEGSRDPEGEPGYHGTNGGLTVSVVSETKPVDDAWMEGVRQFGLKTGDLNGADQEKFMVSRFTIRDGRRCSTARAFLGPASSRPNLDVVIFAHCNKVIFNGAKRAIGVEFNKDGRTFQVFAAREVILSAGAINSPKLLMLSGIGDQNQLAKHGIETLQHLPGVGKNLQEHVFTLLMFRTKLGTSFCYARPSVLLDAAKWVTSGKGHFASPGLNSIGFWRSKYAYDERPDIQIHQLNYIPGGAFPNLCLGYILNFNSDVLFRYMMPHSLRDGMMFAVTLVRPRSKGTISLSSSEPRADPLIDYNLFDDERDLDAVVEGCRLVMNITETPAMQSTVQPRLFDSTLTPCEKYPHGSDSYLRCLTQTLTYTIYHPTSTAKMGSDNDPMAVTDSKCRVRGVAGLRVVDASVMPEVPTGNTNAPTIALAERAADLIKGQTLKPALPPFTDEASLLSYS